MTGSRLARDNRNRLVCIDDGGHVWIVLDLYTVLGFTPPGRPATPRERLRFPPYEPPGMGWQGRTQADDDELDERAALEAARLEQQRRPVDLIGRAA